MLAHGRIRPVAVRRENRNHDRFVLLIRMFDIAIEQRDPIEQIVYPHAVIGNEWHERRSRREFRDCEVQARIEPTVVIDGCRGSLAEPRPQCFASLGVEALAGSSAGRAGFENVAQVEDVVDLHDRHRREVRPHWRGFGHERATVSTATRHEEASIGQRPDRFTHGVAAHRQPRCQVTFRRE